MLPIDGIKWYRENTRSQRHEMYYWGNGPLSQRNCKIEKQKQTNKKERKK